MTSLNVQADPLQIADIDKHNSSFAVAGISSIYREPGDRQAGLTLRHGVTIMGSGALENLLREFLSRKLTPNVPAFANGKP